ncbi:YdcF family protein [Clostridium pasteurianum]|uniref:DUF218 domain-containing protein n=1 Tax=Clostridium pasteurianum BC1 TaxID=86416 RepID=R4K8I2_CLOPA|nr:YdcF family protein [Clostridium pasteurianum]AGK96844.1 hypothetical protein Clopa_1949 [Clostridium pasteurianum BC1]
MYTYKYPEAPDLTDIQIKEITDIVFCKEQDLSISDVLFIYGSTNPATYQKSLEVYNKGLCKDIVISGGSSKSKSKHKDWHYGNKPEARVIFEKLLSYGVTREKIFFEEKSSNSKENVMFAKEIYDFSNVKSLIFISKNYAAGRQYRTLKKYLPQNIKIISYSYNTYLDDGTTFDRYDWMEHPKSISLVLGEYLRIIFYGKKGDIEEIHGIVKGLENYVETILKGVF